MYGKIRTDQKKRQSLRAVHFSDVHLDNDYKAGTLANCTEILCCREEAGWPIEDGDIPAGEWGGMDRCDIPPKTYQSMLDYIVHEIKPDIIFWTGDNSAHDIWKNTSDEEIGYTLQTTQMLK